MVPPAAGQRFDGRRLHRGDGSGGPGWLGWLGWPRPYGKIRHETTSKAVKPIRNTADTAATVA